MKRGRRVISPRSDVRAARFSILSLRYSREGLGHAYRYPARTKPARKPQTGRCIFRVFARPDATENYSLSLLILILHPSGATPPQPRDNKQLF